MGGTVTPQVFGYTGAIVTYVVPQTGLYLIDALGAQGGTGAGVIAAGGGEVAGELSLTQGETLDIAVGGAGGPAGANGYGSGGGGGGSFVVLVDGGVDTVLEVAGGGSAGYLPGGSNAGGGTVGGTGLGGGESPEDDGAGGGGFYGVGQNGVPVFGDTPGNVFSGDAPIGGGDFATGLVGGAGSVSLINGVPDTGGTGGFGGGGGGGALGGDGEGGGGGYTGGAASSGGSSYIDASASDTVLVAGVNVAAPASSTPADGEVTVTYIPCFARGSRVATPSGSVAVETLRPGDRVISHRRGIAVPVRWVGLRRINCADHPRAERLHPVVVCAGAFGRGMPSRDLWLSPDHAIYAEDVLIPVRVLVNGRTVQRRAVREITYVHVELDAHDVLLAEGLPVESFLDTGGRAAFSGASAALPAPWFASGEWEARGCAPLHVVGPAVDRVRAMLASAVTSDQSRVPRARPWRGPGAAPQGFLLHANKLISDASTSASAGSAAANAPAGRSCGTR